VFPFDEFSLTRQNPMFSVDKLLVCNFSHDVSTESAQNCSFFVAWNPHILQKKLNENKNLGYVISNKGYKVSSGSNLKFLTYKLSNQFKPFVHIFSL
jgi:hypothetical protein